MPPSIGLQWAALSSEDLFVDVHRIIHAVVAEGGAVGWLDPPDLTEVQAWAEPVLAEVAAGDAELCLATVDGRAQALACWRRDPGAVFTHCATISKVMVHPSARGLGLGRLVTTAVVAGAERAGLEVVHLGVRGNNHQAVALYERLGFVEWGRFPNVIAVGDLRFDSVHLVRHLARPPSVEWWGSVAAGPGASSASS